MTSLGLLGQADEDALHATRLLNIEEKVFRRLSKRLLTPDTIIGTPAGAPPTPPPDNEYAVSAADSADDTAAKAAEVEARRNQWRNEALLDFAAFESNIVRVQFLLDSNERERERYAEEKVRIERAQLEVKESNARLAARLEEAQATRDLRKSYDALADEITSKKMLRPRDEQHVNIQKLTAEIADLEREKEDYRRTWGERREQFERIVEEGRNMLRLIKDEKEEAERMDDMAGSDNETTPRGSTPRPSGAVTPIGAHGTDKEDGKGEEKPDNASVVTASLDDAIGSGKGEGDTEIEGNSDPQHGTEKTSEGQEHVPQAQLENT